MGAHFFSVVGASPDWHKASSFAMKSYVKFFMETPPSAIYWLPSLVLVCDSNTGSTTRTETAAAMLWRISAASIRASSSRAMLRFAGRQSFRKQQIHFFFQEARRGKKLQKNLQPLRVVARFFFQFARRPFNWGFALVHASRHQLPQELARRISVLLNEQDSPVRQHRKNHHRPGMRNHFPRRSNARRLNHLIPPNSKYFSLVNDRAAQNLRLLRN